MSTPTSTARARGLLVIGAHAADFVWRAAGAIALTTASGGSASVLALSYGERGESGELWKKPGQTVERVKQIRYDEATRAAAALGADFSCMDLGDYPLLLDAAAIDRLIAAIVDHAVMAAAQPGDVLVLTMPEPAPVALVGELRATQALARGVAAILIDAAVRDVEELRALGLPIWARWVRVRGTTKTITGELQVPIEMGGATIRPGDVIVLDADGAVVVAAELRAAFAAGQLSIDIYNLRDAVYAQLAPASQDKRDAV